MERLILSSDVRWTSLGEILSSNINDDKSVFAVFIRLRLYNSVISVSTHNALSTSQHISSIEHRNYDELLNEAVSTTALLNFLWNV